MDTRTGALIIISVLISAVAQVSLKFGMSSSRVATALSDDSHWNTTLTIATTPAVITGLALYVSGAMLWLLVLARVDVSQAYPFVGLGFLVTMALGILVLGETLSASRVAGTLLVATGILLVARS
jgi:multidrug transporter EmrE-like cation transporter